MSDPTFHIKSAVGMSAGPSSYLVVDHLCNNVPSVHINSDECSNDAANKFG